MPVPVTVSSRTVTIGVSKQSAQGTPIAPSSSVGYWLRWLQGSKVRPDADFKQEFEGDGGRSQSLNYKARQNALGKTINYPRPQEAALLLQAVSGAGSSASPTGGWKGTSTAVSAGASGGTLTATGPSTLSAVITSTSPVTFDAGTSSNETVTLATLNTSTGVYTISGTFAKAHAASAPVTIPYTHVITPQSSGLGSPYTLGQNTGSASGNKLYQQAVDCLLNQLVITGGISSPPIKFDADWLGLTNSQSTTLQTTALVADDPYYWFTGVFVLDPLLIAASAQNWTVAVKDLSCTINNSMNVEDYMAETITPNALSFEGLVMNGSLTLLWQDGGMFASTYFNNGSSDDAAVARGQLKFTFASATDSLQTLAINIPAASLKMPDIDPDLSGKPIEQKCEFVALRPASGTVYTATVLNNVSTQF